MLGNPEPPPAHAGASFQVAGGDARAVRRPARGLRQHARHRAALRLHARAARSRSCRPSPRRAAATRRRSCARRRQRGSSGAWRRRLFRPDMSEAARAAAAAPYRERLDFELETIIQMGFAGYFLIVAEFIQWAKAAGIPVGPGPRLGRGLGGRLVAHHHRSRSAALRPAVRALPQSRARVDAGFRHRFLPGPARRGDPPRAGALWPRPRGADHHLRQAAGARGAARCRPRARDALRPGRPHLQARAQQPGQSGHPAARRSTASRCCRRCARATRRWRGSSPSR